MGSEKWSKNEKLTEDEVNNIVDFFYKDKRKELILVLGFLGASKTFRKIGEP